MSHKRNSFVNALFFISDLLAAVSAVFLSFFFRRLLPFGGSAYLPTVHYARFFLLLLFSLLVIHLFSGQYRHNRGVSILREFFSIFRSVFFSLLTLLALSFFYREYHFSRLQILYFFILCIILVFSGRVLLRLVLRMLRRRGWNLLHIAVVGRSGGLSEISAFLRNTPHFGYKISRSYRVESEAEFDVFLSYLEKNPLDQLFIIQNDLSPAQLKRVSDHCSRIGLQVVLLPDFFTFLVSGARIRMIGNIPALTLSEAPLDLWYNAALKRIFDYSIAALVLVLTLPFFLLIAFFCENFLQRSCVFLFRSG